LAHDQLRGACGEARAARPDGAKARRKRPPVGEGAALTQAVYEAQHEALKLPAWDCQIRYVMHGTELFHVIEGWSENYLLIEITLFPGHSLLAKPTLYQGIVRGLERPGVVREDVTIVLHEVPPENWRIRKWISDSRARYSALGPPRR